MEQSTHELQNRPSTSSENVWITNDELSISEMIERTANEVVTAQQLSDYVYYKDYDVYYNEKLGYYYYPSSSLFYNIHTKHYYCYDAETKNYVLYPPSQAGTNPTNWGNRRYRNRATRLFGAELTDTFSANEVAIAEILFEITEKCSKLLHDSSVMDVEMNRKRVAATPIDEDIVFLEEVLTKESRKEIGAEVDTNETNEIWLDSDSGPDVELENERRTVEEQFGSEAPCIRLMEFPDSITRPALHIVTIMGASVGFNSINDVRLSLDVENNLTNINPSASSASILFISYRLASLEKTHTTTRGSQNSEDRQKLTNQLFTKVSPDIYEVDNDDKGEATNHNEDDDVVVLFDSQFDETVNNFNANTNTFYHIEDPDLKQSSDHIFHVYEVSLNPAGIMDGVEVFYNEKPLSVGVKIRLLHEDVICIRVMNPVNGLSTIRSLLVHIHSGLNTCAGCEPGLYNIFQPRQEAKENRLDSRQRCEVERRRIMRQLREDYGLDDRVKIPSGLFYEDRSAQRRKTFGTNLGEFAVRRNAQAEGNQSIYAKCIAAPKPGTSTASVIPQKILRGGINAGNQISETLAIANKTFIRPQNKGFQLLKSMGWSEGSGLGKHRQGIANPVNLVSKTCFGDEKSDQLRLPSAHMPTTNIDARHKAILDKTRKRYERISDEDPDLELIEAFGGNKMDYEAFVHFVGGAVGGTVGTALTCPLEVIKTRLQSSTMSNSRLKLFKFIRDVSREEGFRALYKGLFPNLVGVAPSKAVYFYTYSSFKRLWNDTDFFVPNSAMVHMISAGGAGFITATAINPVWLVKTRLQLHRGPLSVWSCMRRIYSKEGIIGFYRGVTASYVGISETIIQFVLYEYFRSIITGPSLEKLHKTENTRFFTFMIAGGMAKFCACLMTYPHEVVRTRLREEHSIAKGFFSTLMLLWQEGGLRTLYRGLFVQLLRSVPNTALTMGTYEAVVYCMHQYFQVSENVNLKMQKSMAIIADDNDN